MNYQVLLLDIRSRIAYITLNRPKALNALNGQMMHELSLVFDELSTKLTEFDGVIMSGAGEKAFVAGADISEFGGLTQEQGTKQSAEGHQLFFKIEHFPKAVIAVVNGYCLGGGCELAMACHMRIATETARFGQPEVNLGLVPGYGGTQRLVDLVGKAKAMELLMTADMIDAHEAHRLGLANHVLAKDDAFAKAEKIIAKIATKGPLAIAGIVSTVAARFDKSADGYSAEAELFGKLMISGDAKEGASAFLEKRKPDFKGQ